MRLELNRDLHFRSGRRLDAGSNRLVPSLSRRYGSAAIIAAIVITMTMTP
jgi:hypothetical protein